jgi:hypothetical protein
MTHALLSPKRLFSRSEVLTKPSPVERQSGVYAWFFKSVPASVPTKDCIKFNDLTLLYVGISPKAPPLNGAKPSSQNLWHRVRYHYSGNAEGSTLRLTLGCLLSEELGIQLRRVGSGTRMTFTSAGEAKLSDWMEQNAFVTWIEHPTPWLLEDELIQGESLPLNLQGNQSHPFHTQLSNIRSEQKLKAKELPVMVR